MTQNIEANIYTTAMYICGHESIFLSSAMVKAITPKTIIKIESSGLLLRAVSTFRRIHAHGFNRNINPKIFRIFKTFFAFIKFFLLTLHLSCILVKHEIGRLEKTKNT